MELSTEEIRTQFLEASYVHLRVVEFLQAQVTNGPQADITGDVSSSLAFLYDTYRSIFLFYLAHGFIPPDVLPHLINVLAVNN